MNDGFQKEVCERLLRDFMDFIILKELTNNPRISGYDVILLLHKKFHVLLSPGSVYSVLYALERKGWIQGETTSEKRIYKLSDQGQRRVRNMVQNEESIQLFFKSLF